MSAPLSLNIDAQKKLKRTRFWTQAIMEVYHILSVLVSMCTPQSWMAERDHQNIHPTP